MEETYRLIIEFKTIHPLRFWTAIFIATTLIIIVIWRLSRKKQKLKVEHLKNQRPTTTVITEKETVKQKPSTQKYPPHRVHVFPLVEGI